MANNVVINFQSDVEGLKPAVDILYKIGKITEDDVKAFEKANTAQKQMADTAAKSISSYDRLATSVSNVQKNIIDGSVNKAIEGTNELLNKQTKSVDELLVDYKSLKTVIKNATDINDLKKYNQQLEVTEKELKDLGVTFDKNGNANKKTTEGYAKSIQGLKQEYRDLIAKAIEAGEKSPIGQQALKDAGELKDRIADLQQTTKNYGSDTATFEAIGQGISTIGAGFQAAQGAQTLFGEGNEELQKKLVRLQAIMALTNGLQQIQNNLQAESALRLKLASAQQAIYSTVVGTSTGAMKAFRIALASTGIGLIVIALVALIANFDAVSNAVRNFINRFQFLREQFDGMIENIEKFKKSLGFGKQLSEELVEVEKFLNGVLDAMQNQQRRMLELRKSHGKNTLELEKQTNDIILKEQFKVLTVQKQMFIEKAKETGKIDEEEKQKLMENMQNFFNAANAITARNNDIEFELLQRALQARKNLIDARLQFVQKGSEQELKLKLNQIQAELDIENSQRDKIAGQVALNEAKANVARKKAFEDYKQFQLQGELDIQNKKLTIVQEGSKEELDIKRAALDIENQMVLNNSALSQTQKELKLAENAKKELDLIKKYGEAQISLAEQIELKKQKVGNDRLQKFQDDMNAEYEYYNMIAELEFQSSDQNYIRIENLRRTKFDNSIKLLDAELAKVRETNDNIRASEEKLQADLEAKISSDPANRKQYEIAVLESQDRVKTAEQQTADEIVRINREKNLKIIANDNEAEANKKANLLKQTETYVSLANQTSDFLKQINDQELQQNLEKIAAESEANKQNFDRRLITEGEFKKRQQEIADKEQKEKVKAAKREKTINSLLTIANTAASIVKTGAEMGYPAAIPFQVLAGAVGALQLAAINNIKIPEFAKGTEYAPKGWAWVGEKGPELINLTGGQKIKTASNSVAFANTEFKKDFFSNKTLAGAVDASPVLSKRGKEASELFQSEPGFALDYSLLTSMMSRAVGDQIAKLPITHMSFDRKGFAASVQEGSSRINYLDNRYSTN